MDTPKIVVIGNSYSSASVFYYLESFLPKARQPIDLLLISDKSFFYLNDLLSQYLCNSCTLGSLSSGFRDIVLLRAGVSYLQSKVQDIDFNAKLIKTPNGGINYDYLILAPSSNQDDFGALFNDDNSFQFKSLADVVKIKNHIFKSLQDAACESNPEMKKSSMTFSVIGAKERGVELVLSVSDFIYELLKKQFPELKRSLLKFNLIEEANSVSTNKDPFYNSRLFYNLNKKNVTLYLNSKVTRVEEGKITINNEKEIFSDTIIFSSLNKYSSLIRDLSLKKDSVMHGCTDLYLNADGFKNVFLIGESSRCLDLGEDIPLNISFFNKQAKICANNVLAKINNNPLKPLKFTLDIDFHSLGSKNSLVQVKGVSLDGPVVWFLHQLMYVWFQVGWKKKIKVFVNLFLVILGLADFELIDMYEINKVQRQSVKK